MTAEIREHSFDGIQEFNNRLPNWWLWTFYGAIIFSVFYWLHFHSLGTGALPMERYRAAVEAKRAIEDSQPVTDAVLIELVKDPEAVAAGQEVFLSRCMACHKADGGGNIGPNLTDKFWIHGGKPTQLYKTIMDGVPLKGMQAWRNDLGVRGTKNVIAYLLTIKNTNVAGGKDAQGDPETEGE